MFKYLPVLTVLFAGPAHSWGDCDHREEFSRQLDAAGIEHLAINARAGDLRVEAADEAVVTVTATLCAGSAERLAELGVAVEGGSEARIDAVIPDADGGWFNDDYAWIDLEVTVPRGLPLRIQDSSGDTDIRGVGPLELRDSSGDIELIDVLGPVELQDSSGDVDIDRLAGDLRVISDSSGDLYGDEVSGSVLVERDSSGDVRFRDVGGDFIVERDSSGDIDARGVGGDFRVLRDGSGDVDYSDVDGAVEVPTDD